MKCTIYTPARFINTLAAGKLPAVAAPYFCRANLFAAMKKAGGLRPVAVGEVLLRRLCRQTVDFKNGFNLVDRSMIIGEVSEHFSQLSRCVEVCYGSASNCTFGDAVLMSMQTGENKTPFVGSCLTGKFAFLENLQRISG